MTTIKPDRDTNLPPEAVEAAARAMHDDDRAHGRVAHLWEDIHRLTREWYRENARAALSAALPLLPDVGDLLAEMDRLRAVAVKPDRDALARAHVPVDTAFPNPWGCACGESFRTGQQWSGHVIDAVLALLPGRTEAQVKAEALREHRRQVLRMPPGHARADRIERGDSS